MQSLRPIRRASWAQDRELRAVRWYSQACPVCAGDLFTGADEDVGCATCLQCGRAFSYSEGGQSSTHARDKVVGRTRVRLS